MSARLLTLTPTVWVLEIDWEADPEIGTLMYTRTSIHRSKDSAYQRILRTLREITGNERYETVALTQRDGNEWADLDASGTEFSYSLEQRVIEE